ncbi:HAD family hydrolase [Roseivirga sp.]|uniref:HAD family hydrolase n=1 Tax=Roseivirga sp. TaxID=1964215 RepID=UPI003B8D72EC
MPLDLSKINNIIFDLGGVILNIDHEAPIRAFSQLGIPNFDELYSKASQSALFADLETGKITPAEFRDSLRAYLPVELSDTKLNEAWNSIILDFPEAHIRLLEKLKSEKRTFLLSNTNIIHLEVIINRLHEHFGYTGLNGLLEKTYYSHELGMRKPNQDIFKFVMEDANISAEETLFIDDSMQHIETAKSCGLQTHHLKDGESIIDLFK